MQAVDKKKLGLVLIKGPCHSLGTAHSHIKDCKT